METSVPELWYPHDLPERPLEWGAELCECATCARALDAAAQRDPELPIGVKFGLAPRLVVDVGILVADGSSEADLVRRFGEPGDWVREVWVARLADDAMSAGEARFLEVLREHRIPEPAWNVAVDEATGEIREGDVRRLSGS